MTGQKKYGLEKIDWIALGLITLLALIYGWRLAEVPFHPDESTHIFMSKDLLSLFRDPLTLVWDGDLPLDDEERIRAIDAPLAKYLIGTARGAFSTPPLESDWDWSASWEENTDTGALPTRRQLTISRAGITAALVVGLWFYYLAVKKSLPGWAAVFSVLLLGLNPLILLHGRRAMSEGVLVFSTAFFLWAATRKERSPWLIGLVLGLAVNAKHTAFALVPAGIYAVSLIPDQRASWKKIAPRILSFSLVLIISSALLNPFYWSKPLQAFRSGIDARMTLAEKQEADHLAGMGMERMTLSNRGTALLVNTFIRLPQTEEVGNYLAETEGPRTNYLANPLHTWGRGLAAGAIALILAVLGFVLSIRKYKEMPKERKRNTMIWLLSTLGLFGILLTPLPWQRYAVPLLLLSVYWIVSGLLPIVEGFRKDRERG